MGFLFMVHRRGAEDAEMIILLFFADPGGIGFAFHRAGRAENKNMHRFAESGMFGHNPMGKKWAN